MNTDIFGDLVQKHQIAVNELTEKQVAEAIKQAIAAGDFQRNIVSDGRQSVTYIPWREVERIRSQYNELLFAVQSKYLGEDRHETALRYIKEREATAGQSCSEAMKSNVINHNP